MRIDIQRHAATTMRGVMPLIAVVIEVLWPYAWLVWMSTWSNVPWSEPPLALGSAIFLMAASELVSRFFLSRDWPAHLVRTSVVAILLILALAVVRLDLGGGYAVWDPGWGTYARGNLAALAFAVGFSIYLVWRGICIGRDNILFEGLYRRFAVGLVALVLLLVFWGIDARTDPASQGPQTIAFYVIGYFACGVFGLGLANMLTLRDSVIRRGDLGGVVFRRWLALLLGMILVILVAGAGIASAFSFDVASSLLHYLGVMAHWLFIAFIYVVAFPLGVIAAGLVYVFRFLASLVGQGERPSPPSSGTGVSELLKSAEEGGAWTISPEVIVAIKWGLLALACIAVVAFLARALSRQLRPDDEADIEETSESLWAWGSVRAEIMWLLAGLLKMFKRRRSIPLSPQSVPPIAALDTGDGTRLFTVREIYRGLLWEGAKVGLSRRKAETPDEYQHRLEGRISTEPDLGVITDAYVANRYGEVTPSQNALRRLNLLWFRLRSRIEATLAAHQ